MHEGVFGKGSNSGKEIKITMYWNISQHLSFQVREQEPARTKTKITRTYKAGCQLPAPLDIY